MFQEASSCFSVLNFCNANRVVINIFGRNWNLEVKRAAISKNLVDDEVRSLNRRC